MLSAFSQHSDRLSVLGNSAKKFKVTKQENVTIKALNINGRDVICIECYKELGYGRWRISSTVEINDAICRTNYGLHNVLLGMKSAISCCQTFGQSRVYSLMTLIVLAWRKAQSNPGLCFCDIMKAVSCELAL
jgi:hypothetical protein